MLERVHGRGRDELWTGKNIKILKYGRRVIVAEEKNDGNGQAV